MEENKNSYLECKRCFYKCNKKSNMLKHLDKKNICERLFESYKYDDKELFDLSLKRIKYKNKFICIKCNKNFNNNNSLKKHNEKICKKKIYLEEDKNNIPIKNLDIQLEEIENIDFNSTSNNINSNNINSSINNININNINVNITKSFDEQWDTSKIDINKKFSLLFANSKFTKTLENILENQVNLNVLIDNTSNNGIVYNNNKFVNMNVKEIVKQTMNKLYKHLINFHSDIFESNNIDIDRKCLDIKLNLENINNKYTNFNESKDTQDIVKKYITDIYNKKKYNTIDYIENGY
jgi:hypothetical protein